MGRRSEAITEGQMRDFYNKTRDDGRHSRQITHDSFQWFLTRGQESLMDLESICNQWKDLYQHIFEMPLEEHLFRVDIPHLSFEKFSKPLLLVVALHEIGALLKAYARYVGPYRLTDEVAKIGPIEETVTWNKLRGKHGAYIHAVWVENCLEPLDGRNPINGTRRDIFNFRIPTETLAERLIHELWVFVTTGQRLDRRDMTVASGSRFRDGSIPIVGLSGDTLLISNIHQTDDGGLVPVREVVG